MGRFGFDELPVIDISSRRFLEDTAWRIRHVKLERDRHAQRRHLNPLNFADMTNALVDSFKSKRQDAILMLGEETLEIFVEANSSSPDSASTPDKGDNKVKQLFKNMKPSVIKQKIRGDGDADVADSIADDESQAGGTTEMLEGHLFSVGVAFAQVMHVTQHSRSVTVFYHPNSLKQTQSIRAPEANCWRFTCCLDTQQAAAQLVEDIELQLAKYSQAMQWVKQGLPLDDGVHLLAVTAGPASMGTTNGTLPVNGTGQQVITELPSWGVTVPGPASWGKQEQGQAAISNDVIRIYVDSPAGVCRAEISQALVQQHLQGAKSGSFYLKATPQQEVRQPSLDAWQQRKKNLQRFLQKRPSRLQNPFSRESGRSLLPGLHHNQQHGQHTTVLPSSISEGQMPRSHAQGQPVAAAAVASSPALPGASGVPLGDVVTSQQPLISSSNSMPALSVPPPGASIASTGTFLAAGGDMAGSVLTNDVYRAAAPAGPSVVPSGGMAGGNVGATNATYVASPGADVAGAVVGNAGPDQQVAVDARTASLTTDAESLPESNSLANLSEEDEDDPTSPASMVATPRPTDPGAPSLQVRLHCKVRWQPSPVQPPPQQPTGDEAPVPSNPFDTTLPSDPQQLTARSPAALLQSAQNIATTAVQDPQALVQQAQTLGNTVMQNPMALPALVFAGVAVLLQLLGVSLALVVSLGSTVCSVIAVLQQQQQQQQQQKVHDGLQQQQQQQLQPIKQQERSVVESAPSVATGFQLDSGILITLLHADIVSGDISETGESFDTESELDSEEALQHEGDLTPRTEHRKHAALYEWAHQRGISDIDVDRFLVALQQNEREVKQRFEQKKAWHEKNNLVNILEQPQPNYNTIKQALMCGVFGFSKTGHPARYMRVGDMRASWKRLKAAGLDMDKVLRHFVFEEAYIWTKMDPRAYPQGTAIWCVDLGGMGLADLGSEAFQFFKRLSIEVGTYYPERLYKLVLINVPGFFSLLWKICEPVMPESTRTKVHVVRSKKEVPKALADELDAADIPQEFGGSSAIPLLESKEEQEIRAYAHRVTTGTPV